MVLIRGVTESTRQSRLAFGETMVKVSLQPILTSFLKAYCSVNHSGQELNATRKNRGWKGRNFIRSINFDRTPTSATELRKADEVVQDHVVVNIIGALYGTVSQAWARIYPEESALFFSEPYPQIASETLGYPQHNPPLPPVLSADTITNAETSSDNEHNGKVDEECLTQSADAPCK
jgi:hypothetical protein